MSYTRPMDSRSPLRKPDWIRIRPPSGGEWRNVEDILARHELHTVCDEARCPNKAECWGCGTATFIVLGDVCTRNCRFCAVATAREGRPLRPDEPAALARAVAELGLRYVVVTSVDRDDLGDRGSGHFAECIRAIRAASPGTKIEVLVPDYRGGELDRVLDAGPDVLAHNVETVRRLQHVRDARASFDLSLRTLSAAGIRGGIPTKSSMLLGLGESRAELLDAMGELAEAGVAILVLGQYLQPTSRQLPVGEYIPPSTFETLAAEARRLGFSSVVASPFARTSYHAREAYGDGDRA